MICAKTEVRGSSNVIKDRGHGVISDVLTVKSGDHQ